MSAIISVAPTDLLIDTENPRLPITGEGQRAALKTMAKELGKKLVTLAADIVTHGLNPSDLPIVTSAGGKSNQYIVLEGNRRIAAIKALESPEVLSDTLAKGLLDELRKLSARYQDSPVETVSCVLYKVRPDADHWIQLRHTGENEGAGLVPWGPQEKDRFLARSGRASPPVQVLDYLERAGVLSAELRQQVPLSNLRRLLSTPEVRANCGIDFRGGELHVLGQPPAVLKALMYVVKDLATKTTDTTDIYTADDRREYAAKMPAAIVVKPTAKPGPATATGGPAPATPKPAAPRIPRPRDVLIPRDCTLVVSDPRVKEIEGELRRLSLDLFTNAVSVLFRVFLELSTDVYLEGRGINLKDLSLANKLTTTLDDLMAQKKITSQQAKPVRRAAQADCYLSPSVKLMHDYVHNQHAFPTPSDLRGHWNSLQPFVVAIWSV